MRTWCGNEWRWELVWRRLWFQWENSLVQQLREIIERKGPKMNVKDGREWRKSTTRKYVVKEVYQELNEEGNVEDQYLFKKLWKLLIPSKVKGFILRVTHDKVQT